MILTSSFFQAYLIVLFFLAHLNILLILLIYLVQKMINFEEPPQVNHNFIKLNLIKLCHHLCLSITHYALNYIFSVIS